MKGVEDVAKKYGWGYKVWTNDDLTAETFPMTWEFIQISIRTGEELEQSRFAQVADLARLEILHRFGGVYLDSLFEIGPEFLAYIKKAGKTHDLLVANEDPCKLKCVGANNKKYMSNGFFACIPGCPTLKRLLNYDALERIDYTNVHINQTTGPYYFRSMMESKDKIHVIDTEKIYPFMINSSKYRAAQPNGCIIADDKVLHDCLHKKYSSSLAVYHSGFGGSWSW
jgi:mannosyltransferase OCH1-like enzyme